jgi:hypothetical protein
LSLHYTCVLGFNTTPLGRTVLVQDKLLILCAITMTTDSSVTPPNEREKPTAVDIEKVPSEKASPTAGLDAERNALLATLPDPDAGKSEEERREIVSQPQHRHGYACY